MNLAGGSGSHDPARQQRSPRRGEIRLRLLSLLLLAWLGALFGAARPAEASPSVGNSPDCVDEGSSAAFTLTVTHPPSEVDSLCTVTLTADAAFSAVAPGAAPSGWTAAVTGNVITWSADSLAYCLPPDSEIDFPWSALAPSEGGSYPCAWSVGGGLDAGSFDICIYSPSFSTSAKSALDINGGDLRPGDTIAYQIDVINSGDMTASGVVVTDTLSTSTSSVNGISNSGVYAPGPPKRITWNLGAISAGTTQTLSWNAVVATPLNHGTSITNRAAVRSDQTPTVLTNQTGFSITSAPILSASTKAVTDIDGHSVSPGDSLRYVLSIRNTGDMNATSVVVRDTLDTDIAAVTGITGSGTLTAGPPKVITWNVGTLNAGATVTRQFDGELTFPLDEGTTVLNRGAVTSGQTSSVLTNQVTSTVVSAPLFTASTKTATDLSGAPLRPGDSVAYSLTIRNTGDMNATGVTVLDTLATQFAGASAISGGGTYDAGPPATIAWSLGSIAAGAQQVLTYNASLDSPIDHGTVITNRAGVASDQTSSVLTSTSSLSVASAPSFSTDSKGWEDINGGLLQAGDIIEYTLTIPNTGDMNATGVVVTDLFPAHLTYVTGSTTLNGLGVGDVAGVSPLVTGMAANSPGGAPGVIISGESAVITVRLTVDDDVVDGQTFTNSFTETSSQGVSGGASVTSSGVDIGVPSLTGSPDADVNTCDLLSYELRLIPDEAVAWDVHLDTELPAGFSYQLGSTLVRNSGTGATSSTDAVVSGGTIRWNHDGTNPNPGNAALWDVAPSDTLVITFELRVESCVVGDQLVTTTEYHKPGAGSNYAPSSGQVATTYNLLEGALTVEKSPIAPAAAVGDTIQYTLSIESVGFGSVSQVVLADSLLSGIRLVPGLTSPAPSSIEMHADSTTLLIWDASTPGLDRLQPGDDFTIQLAVRLIDCRNYDDIFTARWGCADQLCETKSTVASVNLLLAEPELTLSLSPDPITVTACDTTGTLVTLTVANSGGAMRNTVLDLVGLPATLELDSVTGAAWSAGDPFTFDVGTVAARDTVALQFRVRHVDNCSPGSGAVVFLPSYSNVCGDPYNYTSLVSSITTSGLPSLTVTQESVVEIDQGAIQPWGFTLCSTLIPPQNPVTVTATHSGVFTFQGDESPPATNGGGLGDATTTWIFAPGDFDGNGCVEVDWTLAASGSCGATGTITVNASTTTDCGGASCNASAGASALAAIDCDTETTNCVPLMTHTVNDSLSTTESVCGPMTHEVEIWFDDAADLSFSELTFKAEAEGGKSLVGHRLENGEYVYNVARFTYTDSSGASCSLDLEPTRDGNNELSWNLSPLDELHLKPGCAFVAPPVLAGGRLRIDYDLRSEVDLAYHFEFARLVISGSAGCDGTYNEPVQVTIGHSTMQTSLTVPTMIDKCVPTLLNLTVSKSGEWPTYDNVLYLATDQFELIDDPDDPDFALPHFVGLPNLGMPTRVDDIGNGSPGVMWKLGDLDADFGSGTITLPTRLRCDGEDAVARVVYDDLCGDEDTDNITENSYAAVATTSPVLVRSANVSLQFTPETYFAEGDSALWTLFVINGGTGAAPQVTLTSSTPGTGLAFTDYALYDGAGVERSEELTVAYGAGSRTATFVIDEIPAGETWRVRIHAAVTGCDDLLHDVSGYWGCEGDSCQSGGSLIKQATVELPPVLVISDLSAGGTAASCEERAVTLTIKNASAARARGSVVRVRLPQGLSYIDDSSTIAISHPGGASAPVVLTPSGSGADPDLVTDELVWTLSEHLSTSYLSPQDIVTLTFSLLVDAGFEEGIVFSSGTYSDGCNRTLDMTSDRSTFASERIDVDAFVFSLDVDSLHVCSQYGVDDTRLTYTVANPTGNGDAFGPVELSLTLPAGVAYIPGTTAIEFPIVTGSATHRTEPSVTGSGTDNDRHVLNWTLGSNTLIEAGESIVVAFDARHQGSFGCALPEQTTELSLTGQRCAAGTAGGSAFTTESTAIPFHFQEPDLSFRLELFDRTANGATAPGDTVQVLAILENAGSGSARSPSLEVVLDADGLTYLSSTPPRDSSAGATSTWDSTLGSIAAGEIDTVLVLAVVQQGVDLGEVLQVDGSLTEGCCDQLATDRALLVTSGQAHLDIEKSATQAVVVPGETVTYQLLIHNDGSQAFRNVVIDETSPLPGLAYLESEYDADHVTFSGTVGAPQWTIAASDSAQAPFTGGATEIIRVSYRVADDYSTIGTPAGSGRVNNTASITSLENLSGASLSDAELLDSDTESLPVQVDVAAVSLSKVAVQGAAEPGELVTYLLRVTNHGGQALQDLAITDLPAAGLTFVSSQYPSEVTETDTSPPTYALTSLPELLAREIAVTFRVDSDTTVSGSSLTNLATVTARDESGALISPDSASVTIPVIPASSALDLAKLATRGDVVPGESITYQLHVTNPGATELTDVLVVDTPPSGLTLVAVEHDEDVLQTSGSPPTFSIASLPAGAAELISLSFETSADTTLLSDPVVNTASAAGTDPSGATITADPATSSLPVTPRVALLRVQKVSTQSEVVPGSTFSYILVVSNPGEETLTNVEVVDEPPSGLFFLGAEYDPARVSQLLDAPPTFRIDSLEPDALELITVRFRASADPDSLSDPVINLALAEARDASGQWVTADTTRASLPVSDLPAALDLEKTAAQAVVVPGGTVTYELLLQNSGARELRNIVVAESASLSGLTFLESHFDSNLVSWTGTNSSPEWTVSSPGAGHPAFAPYGSTIIRVTYTVADDYTLIGTPPGSGRVDNVIAITGVESREGTPLAGASVLVSDTESLPVQVPVAALDLQKVAIHGVAVPGTLVTYLLRVTNRGNQDLHDIAVVDTAPTGLVFQSSQFDGAVTEEDTDPPTYTIANLPILGSEEIALSFLVGDDLTILGDSLTNVATGEGLDAGGATIDADTARVTIAVSPPLSRLDLSKIATSSVVTPGSTVSYLLIAENRGDTDLSDVTLTDVPPPGFVHLHADHDADVAQTDSDPPTFVVSSLPAGSQELVTLVFAIDPDTTKLSDPSVNQATLVGLDPSGNAIAADPASSSLPIATRSSTLRVTKTATESFIRPGEPITYLLTVTNPGEEPLTDIEVQDFAPTGLSLAYAQYDAGRVSELAMDPPTYRIANLASHDWEQIALTFEVTDDPDSLSDPVINRAKGIGIGSSGQPVESDTTACSIPRAGSPHGIDIEKSCLSTELVAGELADYLLRVTNRGESELHSVTVSDILPADLSYVASEPAAIEAPAGTLTWDLSDLEPGESHQITLRALVDYDPAGTITNTAGVTALTPGNVSVTDSDQITSAASPGASSLHLEKSPTAGHLTLGGQVTYLLEVSNDGDQALSSVSLVDSLPSGTVYAGSDHDPGRWNLISVAPIVRWDLIGDLLPGESEEVALYLDGGDDFSDFGLSGGDTTLVNVATVTAEDPQGGTPFDVDTGVVQLVSPLGAVLLNKVCTLGEIVPGEDVLYVLTAENIGDQDLYPFQLREPDLSSQGLSFVGSEFDPGLFSYSFDGTQHLWSAIAPFAPGQRSQVRVTFNATADLDLLADPVVNVASILAYDQDGTVATDSDAEGVPLVDLTSAVRLEKSAARGAVTPGEMVDYVLTVSNTGDLPLVEVVISESDLGDQGLRVVGSNFDPEFWAQSDSLTWVALDSLSAGDTREIRVSYRASAIEGALPLSIENSARVTALDVYGRARDDVATEALPLILGEPALHLDKSAVQSALVPGRPVTYLLALTNNGDRSLRDVVVSDSLPTGTSFVSASYDPEAVALTADEQVVRFALLGPFPSGGTETIRLTLLPAGDAALLTDPTVNRASARGWTDDGRVVGDADAESLPLQLPWAALDALKIPLQNLVEPGAALAYELIVRNGGDTPLSDVTVLEQPPSGVYFERSEHSSLVAWSGTEAAPAWYIKSLPVGASETIIVWFRADRDPGLIQSPARNEIVVSAFDAAGTKVSDEAVCELPVRATRPALRLEKLALDPVAITGDRLSYSIRLTNVGEDTLYSSTIRDPLPAGITYDSSVYDATRAQFSADPVPTWNLVGPLPPGDSFSLRLNVTVPGDTTLFANPIVNRAEAEAWDVRGISVHAEAAEQVPVEQDRPLLNLQKSTDAAVVVAGRSIVYTLTLTNVGNRELRDVMITDKPPAGLRYVSANFDARQVEWIGTTDSPRWSMRRLEQRQIETITVRFVADADPASIPGPVINLAEASGVDPSGALISDIDDESTPVQSGAAALQVSKVATRGAIEPGEDVTYLITVVNQGGEALHEVEVRDNAPEPLRYRGSHYDGAHVVEVAPGEWRIESLPIGGFEQIRASFLAPADSTYADLVRNVVRVSALDTRGEALADSADEQLPVDRGLARVHLDKRAVDAYVTLGEEVSYDLLVTNTGSAELRDVMVADDPSAGLRPIRSGFDNRTVIQESPLRFRIPRLAAHESEEIRLTFATETSLGGLADGDTVANRARVTGRTADGSEVGDEDLELLPIRREASAIQVLKWTDFTGDATYPGTEVAFHLQVTNIGRQRMQAVHVVDLLPAGLKFKYADLPPNDAVEDSSRVTGGAAHWSIDSLEPGESWEVLVVTEVTGSLSGVAVLENRAVVSAVDENAEIRRDEDLARVRVRLPRLDLIKTADRGSAAPGETITYRVTCANPGDLPAENVLVTDRLHGDLLYIAGSALPEAEYLSEARSVVANLGRLLPGQATSFEYAVQVTEDLVPPELIGNSATVYADDLAPVESDTVWVRIETADLTLYKSVDRATAVAGDTLTYALRYVVGEGSSQSAVSVVDALPPLTEYVSSSPFAGFDPGRKELIWPLGDLGPGEAGILVYRVIVVPEASTGDLIANIASIRSAERPAVQSNEVRTVVEARRPLRITKRVSRPAAAVGEELEFAITVVNEWDRPSPDVRIEDRLPEQIVFAGQVSDGGAHEDGIVRWSLGTLLPQETRVVRFLARVRAGVPSGTIIRNTAWTAGSEVAATYSNTVLTAVRYTELRIEKDVSPARARVGDTVRFAVTVHNEGQASAHELRFLDDLPAGMNYVAGTSRLLLGEQLISSEDPVGQNPIVLDAARLAPGGRLTWSYDVRIGSTAAEGSLKNRVRLTAQGEIGDSIAIGPAEAAVDVVLPHLAIAKTTPERAVEHGELIWYSIKLQNPSHTPVDSVVVRDVPPFGFEYLPGSARLNGTPLTPLHEGPAMLWIIGKVEGSQSNDLTYALMVGLNAPIGVATNSAWATGLDPIGGTVAVGPAEARVDLLLDQNAATIRGRVILLCEPGAEGDQTELPGVGGIEITLEDGRRTQTDAAGEYWFHPVAGGDHLVRVDRSALRDGVRLVGRGHRFLYALPGGQARADFRACIESRPGRIEFSKGLEPDALRRIQHPAEPDRFTLQGINFETGQASLRANAHDLIDSVAARVRELPTARIVVEGHTDIRPIRTAEFADNYELSIARAEAAKRALVTRHGIDPARIRAVGYGPDHPLRPGRGPLDLQANRRVEVLVYADDPESAPIRYEPSEVDVQLTLLYSGEVPLSGLSVQDDLPTGLEYVPSSSRVDDLPREPFIEPGERYQRLSWSFGAASTGFQRIIRYRAKVVSAPADVTLASPARLLWQEIDGSRHESAPVSAQVALASTERIQERRYTLESVFFESGRADVLPLADASIELIRTRIAEMKDVEILIEGHTDSRPIRNSEYPDNVALSLARAERVREVLIAATGADPSRFTLRGHGPGRPIAPNTSATGRAQNRRVEITVVGRSFSAHQPAVASPRGGASAQIEITVAP